MIPFQAVFNKIQNILYLYFAIQIFKDFKCRILNNKIQIHIIVIYTSLVDPNAIIYRTTNLNWKLSTSAAL